MAEVRLSVSARADLRRIYELGIEQFGKAAADRHLDGFERLFGVLRGSPSIGSPRPELGANMRSLSHRPHRLLYRVGNDAVLIVRIIHHAQDTAEAMKQH